MNLTSFCPIKESRNTDKIAATCAAEHEREEALLRGQKPVLPSEESHIVAAPQPAPGAASATTLSIPAMPAGAPLHAVAP